jgi:hypothetical protein
MASQISKIEKKLKKTEEGIEGGMSRRPNSFVRMRGSLCSQMGSRKLFAKIFVSNTFDVLCWLYPSCLIVDIYKCWH